MKLIALLPLAALSSAFVIPDDVVMSQIAIESPQNQESLIDNIPSKDKIISNIKDTFSKVTDTSKDIFDYAFDYAGDKVREKCHQSAYDAEAWLDSAPTNVDELSKRGHYGKPNLTIYELISKSKYTTKLAALVNDYEDLVELLNGTAANYTLFAPIDAAFEKIPKHAPKPSKEELKEILTYHVSPDFYPAGRVLVTHTIPTLLAADLLGGEPQRLVTAITLKGLTVNYYSRVVAVNIFGTNGVIHGVASILAPPPTAAKIIQLLPGEFSTLELGLTKTGLLEIVGDTSNHVGGTIFAPSNFAFQKLGTRINAFLFSKYGQKYLKALLLYHVVANRTLYSDAYYEADSKSDLEVENIPNGYFHVDLPTLLKEKTLSVDVGRLGRFIQIKINGFSNVVVEDGVAADGVIQVVGNVLVPPKSVGGTMEHWGGEEMTEEDLKERLEPYLQCEEL